MRVTTMPGPEAPHAVVCDGPGADMVAAHPGMPVLVVGTGDALESRLEAVSGGAAGFLDIDVPASEIMDQVTLARSRSEVSARVLVFGDDDAETVAALTDDGFEVVATGLARVHQHQLRVHAGDRRHRARRPGDRRAGSALGAIDYLIKPVTPDELAERVETALGRRG